MTSATHLVVTMQGASVRRLVSSRLIASIYVVPDAWMTSDQAADRLGVKAATLYAYVSRGMLRSERTPGERRSRFLRSDVEKLAARQRSGGRAGALDIVIETELTLLDPTGHLAYRGWDVMEAAATATFEEVASWLLTGARDHIDFTAPDALVRAGSRVVKAMRAAPAVDQLRGALAAMRSADPFRHDRRPAAVAESARGIVATFAEVLPLADGQAAPRPGASLAARLWSRVSTARPTAARIRLLDATLVLLADHELAASTLAARVAASTWADPYLVVGAGLATLGGPLHGGASTGARAMIRSVVDGQAAVEAIDARLRDGRLIPGFGHRIYADVDPRAVLLLRLLDDTRDSPVMRAGRSLTATMQERRLPFPNVDFSLALLAESNEMSPDAIEVVFAISRTVGWLAHAIEEYQHRLRFRPRAVYAGHPVGPQ
jgi:citrate synthase